MSDAIGPYSYADEANNMIAPLLCFYHYKEGRIFGFNESYVFNNEINECKFFEITCKDRYNNIRLNNLKAVIDLNGDNVYISVILAI